MTLPANPPTTRIPPADGHRERMHPDLPAAPYVIGAGRRVNPSRLSTIISNIYPPP